MSTNKAQSSSKEQWWRRQVRQWRSSGLSVRALPHRAVGAEFLCLAAPTLAQRKATAVPLVPLTVKPEPKLCDRGRLVRPRRWSWSWSRTPADAWVSGRGSMGPNCRRGC